jgi:hypothetical protein
LYFIFEIEFSSDKSYIATIIKATKERFSVDVEVIQVKNKIVLIAKKDDLKLESFLKELESSLPASIYLTKSRHYESKEKPEFQEIEENDLPIDLSLCPSCQKEMFDVSSRRYYYPFTSCNSCGSHHAFLDKYPLTRANSTMKFLVPCEACKEEMKKNPLRKDYPLISCIDCGIALKMVDKKSERYANDKGSYRQLFEVSAKAIAKGKSILFQTTFGYRKFFKPTKESDLKDTILLLANASKLNTHLMMVPQEFNALLSIERPLLRVATKSKELKELYGSTAWCKYPDDGLSMLLAKEIINTGLDFIAYRECDEHEDADLKVSFDIPIESQKDMRLFINQDTKLIIDGERSIFPQRVVDAKRGRVVFANDLVMVDEVIDKMNFFEKLPANEVLIKKGEPLDIAVENKREFEGFKASMLSVLKEHDRLDEKAVGVHFDDRLHFLYYNQKEVIDIVPPREFEADNLFENIANLRDGSDRLVENFKKKLPLLYEKLDGIKGEKNLFEITAMILELDDESFDGISSKALEFMGKGGLQIDTKVEDNRFNDYAFLASIISYKLTDAQNSLLCYSIYESFGDYIADIVNQLMNKTKASTLTLSGKSFANQALWGRIERNLKIKNPILNINYPIGEENQVYGAGFL